MEKQIMFHLGQELYDLLATEKKRTGASLSEIIRRAIKKYLENK